MANILLSLSILFMVIFHQCHGNQAFLPFAKSLREKTFKGELMHSDTFRLSSSRSESNTSANSLFSLYVSPQNGLKASDKIDRLPGQPFGVDFNQYSGYVKVDTDRALFYYLAESPRDSSSKPLLMWFEGGVGCSSFGMGALIEIGPFRVHKDGKTLYRNRYAWNLEANLIFVEAPASVGFSYSNTTADYDHNGDATTAYDMYTFLINWLERFPEYKNRDLFFAGEGYAGHYATQLAQLIIRQNKYSDQAKAIRLKGVALGDSYIDYESSFYGSLDYAWTHALISDEIYVGVYSNCNISSGILSDECKKYLDLNNNVTAGIDPYNIYAPLCNSTPGADTYSHSALCSVDYVSGYVNNPEVQIALHANAATVPRPWKFCNYPHVWTGSPETVLPIITELMESGIQVWIYSGDLDSSITVTCAKYAVNKLKLAVKTAWYPWQLQNEVGGYAVEYHPSLTLITVRGAGNYVPYDQPERAFALFSSFLGGKLPRYI